MSEIFCNLPSWLHLKATSPRLCTNGRNPQVSFLVSCDVSAGDRSMSTSLSASQLHTVNMREPLNRVLGENHFLGAAQRNEATQV